MNLSVLYKKSSTMASHLTAEMLADLQIPHDVCLSPSGQQVVYSLRPDADRGDRWVSSLWIAEVGKEHSSRRLTDGKSFDMNPQWSLDSRSVAFISDKAKEGVSAVIYLQAVDGGEPVALTPAENQASISKFSWSPDGRYIAYLSPDEKSPERKAKDERKDDPIVYGEDWQFNRLRMIEVDSKKITALVSDDCQIMEFTWSPDSNHIAYVTSETPEIHSALYHGVSFKTVSIDDQKTSYLAHFPSMIQDICWVGSDLWWRSTYTLPEMFSAWALYGMSITEKKWSRRAYGEKQDAGSLTFPPGMRSTKAGLVCQVLSGLRDQLHIVPSGQIIFDEMTLTRGWDVTLANDKLRNDKLVISVIASTPSTPNEVYSIINGTKTCLSNHGQAINSIYNADAIPIHTKAQDGTPLDALLYTPSPNPHPQPSPTIIIPHSGPCYRVTLSFDPEFFNWTPYLLSRGFSVLAPNYGGSTAYGEAFAARVRGGTGHEDYSDVIDLVKAGIAQGRVDEHRVGIAGWSAGGFLSYLAVTRDSTFHFAAAVAGAGGSDWDLSIQTSDTPVFAIQLAGRAPWSLNDHGANTENRFGSPIHHMDAIRTPVLILHGENDNRVDIAHARSFHFGCLERGVECEFVVYPRELHGALPPFERAHYVDTLVRMGRWFERLVLKG